MEQPQANKRLSIKQEPSEVSKNIVLWVPRNHPLMNLGVKKLLVVESRVSDTGIRCGGSDTVAAIEDVEGKRSA
ncbi:hypothetical protein TNCV_3448131 [Trichonephila clavipes]|nr:hypothetical protein TNCV_3448131 [Trichonephila clavipes]